ncbi:hydrolase [Mesorhizobium sp. L-8-10]|uniref:HAD family hydrolase n=1 Tax=Mesorhizobium sp. L-8-10 TaxID=2744523 RepID=UPI001927749C|nr:HAD family hydrolase [Mesorhizobium sp. L-8-10]BCH34443.1 hydrolase [Mesorhizobium sp. L-8-10]
MTTDLLIFDCDGVLIDSEPVASGLFAKALQRAGLDVSAAEVHMRFTGASEKESRRILIDEYGLADADRVFLDANAELYAEFARSLRPMPGMQALVKALHHRRCVASNSGLERLRRSLGLFDLWHEFAPHVFSAEMVEQPKPAPDLFLLCAERLGVAPQRCIVIDDSTHGVAGAVAAGMRAIGFVDPADPRERRHAILAQAGAALVVEGAAELAAAIDAVSPASTRRTQAAGMEI